MTSLYDVALQKVYLLLGALSLYRFMMESFIRIDIINVTELCHMPILIIFDGLASSLRLKFSKGTPSLAIEPRNSDALVTF